MVKSHTHSLALQVVSASPRAKIVTEPGPLLMLAAMRSLGETAEGYEWAYDQVQHILLPHAGGCGHLGATLLVGGVPGPEVWAAAHARRFGLRVVTYHADGTRTDTHGPAGRWLHEQLKGSSRERDQQLAADLAARARSGRRVQVFGLLDASPEAKAAKSGTAYRLACAESAGLAVHRFFLGQAPAQEAAPQAAE